MKKHVALAILAMFAGACSAGHEGAGRTLTERERDSVLSRSDLPGAGTVGRAMSESDREAERAASVNAMVDSLPR